MTSTRPNTNFAIGLINKFLKNPCQLHLQVVKQILRYTGGICSDEIFYSKNDPIKLFGYTDSDWIGDTVKRKSTSEYALFKIISEVFSLSSKKQ